jgi:peptidoglycan/LPS O-acetylase OafA/YrhL
MSLIELLLLLSVVVIISSHIEYQSLLASFIFCLVVLVFALEKGVMSDILRKKIFISCGKLSYSIYMTHWAILFIILAILNSMQKLLGFKLLYWINSKLYVDFGNSFINNLVVILIVLLVIKISSYTYTYIELKGQAIGRKLNKIVIDSKI